MKQENQEPQQDRNEQQSAGSGRIDPRTGKKEEEGAIYLTSDSTLQTPEEDAHDRSVDPGQDDDFSVQNDDLHETKGDRLRGSDRAGTAERQDNSME